MTFRPERGMPGTHPVREGVWRVRVPSGRKRELQVPRFSSLRLTADPASRSDARGRIPEDG